MDDKQRSHLSAFDYRNARRSAGLVAVGVVEALELVQVQQRYRDRGSRALRPG